MIDDLRDTLRKATKVLDAPRQRAEETVRKMAGNPDFDLTDPTQLARDFLRMGREQAGKARRVLDGEVRRRLTGLGLATKDEVDRLRRRINELEAAADENRPAPVRRAGTAPNPAGPSGYGAPIRPGEEGDDRPTRAETRAAAAKASPATAKAAPADAESLPAAGKPTPTAAKSIAPTAAPARAGRARPPRPAGPASLTGGGQTAAASESDQG